MSISFSYRPRTGAPKGRMAECARDPEHLAACLPGLGTGPTPDGLDLADGDGPISWRRTAHRQEKPGEYWRLDLEPETQARAAVSLWLSGDPECSIWCEMASEAEREERLLRRAARQYLHNLEALAAASVMWPPDRPSRLQTSRGTSSPSEGSLFHSVRQWFGRTSLGRRGQE